MRCPSCGGTTRKYAICGRCRADSKRWQRLAEQARKKAEAKAKKDARDFFGGFPLSDQEGQRMISFSFSEAS